MTAAVLGMGSWGTALALHLAQRGHTVRAWTHEAANREALRAHRENRNYLPGKPLPESIQVIDSIVEALSGSELAVLAVPSFAVREVSRASAGDLNGIPVVNVAKGLEEGSHLRMLEVLAQELGEAYPTASLVGPSHAEEVAERFPTAVVATSRFPETATLVQDAFADEALRVYTNPDVVGVELAVALKNVIAIAAGVAAGLGYGDNTAGALVTRGLAEMTRLGCSFGAKPETFFGLAGVGDLVTTCLSRHSRNRGVGERLGRGESLEAILADMTMVAEGVRTTRAAHELASNRGVDMPIVDRVHAVLFENQPPREAILALMSREPKAEGAAPNEPARGIS